MAIFALALLAFSAGCGGSDSTNVADTAGKEAETPKESESSPLRTTGPTVAVLHPIGDVKATGTARFLIRPDGRPLLKLKAHGLEPVAGDRQYIVWQKRSRNDMFLLSTWHVGEDRKLVEKWEPDASSRGYLEEGSRTKLLITKIELNDRLYEPGASENAYEHNVIGKPILEGQFEGALVGATERE